MTVTLDLRPEIEAELAAQARASGQSIEQLVISLIEEAAVLTPEHTAANILDREDAVRLMLEFGEKHRLSLGEPITRGGRGQPERRDLSCCSAVASKPAGRSFAGVAQLGGSSNSCFIGVPVTRE